MTEPKNDQLVSPADSPQLADLMNQQLQEKYAWQAETMNRLITDLISESQGILGYDIPEQNKSLIRLVMLMITGPAFGDVVMNMISKVYVADRQPVTQTSGLAVKLVIIWNSKAVMLCEYERINRIMKWFSESPNEEFSIQIQHGHLTGMIG